MGGVQKDLMVLSFQVRESQRPGCFVLLKKENDQIGRQLWQSLEGKQLEKLAEREIRGKPEAAAVVSRNGHGRMQWSTIAEIFPNK